MMTRGDLTRVDSGEGKGKGRGRGGASTLKKLSPKNRLSGDIYEDVTT